MNARITHIFLLLISIFFILGLTACSVAVENQAIVENTVPEPLTNSDTLSGDNISPVDIRGENTNSGGASVSPPNTFTGMTTSNEPISSQKVGLKVISSTNPKTSWSFQADEKSLSYTSYFNLMDEQTIQAPMREYLWSDIQHILARYDLENLRNLPSSGNTTYEYYYELEVDDGKNTYEWKCYTTEQQCTKLAEELASLRGVLDNIITHSNGGD